MTGNGERGKVVERLCLGTRKLLKGHLLRREGRRRGEDSGGDRMGGRNSRQWPGESVDNDMGHARGVTKLDVKLRQKG